tara:strand:- start:2711 stop:3751 length:1041 start_codon:yes stop_codon:yes gene_type:complete
MSLDCDSEWANFCLDNTNYICENDFVKNNQKPKIPKCSDIYISTKTMIAYLSTLIDIQNVFWKLKIMDYSTPKEGIIKKQIKINFASSEETNEYKKRIENEKIVEETIISNVITENKFKDIRKVSIGISKKDILSNRCKKKSAFYNCFVVIFRIKHKGIFKEAHVKVFNTGKLEIPGIQSDDFLEIVLRLLKKVLYDNCNINVSYDLNKTETVLINSNFNCGFYLDREKFYNILKMKYNIHCSFDPCSYPGIMCKYYYILGLNKEKQCGVISNNKEKHISVSFMIFRTGSVLIVGKCTEKILIEIYEFLKIVIKNEYDNIYQQTNIIEKKQPKTRKIRKKTIVICQ